VTTTLPAVTLAATDPTRTATDALVIGIAQHNGKPELAPGAEAVDKALKGGLRRALEAAGATGAPGEVTKIPTYGALKPATVVATGLGRSRPDGSFDPEAVRRAAGAAARGLAGTATASTTLALVNGDRPDEALHRAVAEGFRLGGYAFTAFRGTGSAETIGRSAPVRSVAVLTGRKGANDKQAVAAQHRARVVTEAVALARDLVNTPPGNLHPADLAAAAAGVAKASGLDLEILDEKALRKGGYGGILGVGQGSVNPPRLVRLAYTHRKKSPTVHLVGKGITFDSGGLSIKPAASMEWMKSDMGGAAAVIATLQAVAALKPAVNVVGWAPTAENMPSGSAIRPSDVLQMYGGKTVEVLNTDAEGRLILADAIGRACEEKPDVLFDVATLTGAQLVALGSHTFGVMGNDDSLRAAVVDAAERAGEQSWPMPLPVELRQSLDSAVADLQNTGDRYGGMLVAGLFLKEFVADGVPWAHLDIAGPAFNQGQPHGYTPKGGTGAAVRTFVQFVEDLAAGQYVPAAPAG
jgi:leucyl aminopeptidase